METGIEARAQEHRDVLRVDVNVQCGEGLLHRRVSVSLDECASEPQGTDREVRSRPFPADCERHQEDASGSQISLPAALLDVGPIEAPEVIARLVPRYQEKLRQLGYEIDAQRLHEILCTSFPDLRAVAEQAGVRGDAVGESGSRAALGRREAQGREKAT